MNRHLVAIAVAWWPAIATGADAPPSQYIDQSACPFECCTYRAWQTNADTVAYAHPAKHAKAVDRRKRGAIVEAITGEVHSRSMRFVVKKPHAAYEPGGVLWV